MVSIMENNHNEKSASGDLNNTGAQPQNEPLKQSGFHPGIQPPYPQYSYYDSPTPQEDRIAKNGMIYSIVALSITLLPNIGWTSGIVFSIAGWILGLIFGIMGLAKCNRMYNFAYKKDYVEIGKILGIVAIVLSSISIIVAISNLAINRG
jgi:hypothetical protein